MRISTIAFANLKRRKGKALFLIIGIAIGIGTAVALLSLSGSIKEEIGSQLDRFGANIVVVPQSNSLALDYGGVSVSSVSFDVQQLKTEDARNVLDIPYSNRISIVSPKLLGAVGVDGHEVLLAGIDFKNELTLKRWWHIVGRKPDADADLLIGYEAARALSLIEPITDVPVEAVSHEHSHDGDHEPPAPFKILRDHVQIAGREHPVAGVIAPTGGPEDRMIFGSLAHVQSLLNKPDQLSLIEVSALCKDCPIGDIVAQISERLPHAKVSAIQQSVRARTETVARLTRFSAAVSAVVLAIGALMIFTTMMGSVVERTKEIGVLRAIGFRRQHIVKELMIEVGVISVLGGLAGWLAGMLVAWAALPYFAETERTFQFHPALALAAIVAGLAIGMASSFYPIVRASRLDPSEAVRYMKKINRVSFITIENVSKVYPANGASAEVRVLDAINADISEGEFVCLMGPSGSGKSTLLTIVGAMNHPTAGRVLVDGIDVYDLEDERRADFRREYLGFVFQQHHLLAYLNTIENAMLPLATINITAKEKHERAERVLEKVGLADKQSRLPNELSGGEQGRLAIARALVNEPPLILADEPTGALDSKTGREIIEVFLNLNAQGQTIFMVTHNPDNAVLAHRTIQIVDGRIA